MDRYVRRVRGFVEGESRARNKDFALIGHFVFPWLHRFGKFPIYVFYVLARGDLIGHFGKMVKSPYSERVK